MTFIIDVPLSLTPCSGRDRQSVVVKDEDTIRHIIRHLHTAVVEIDKVW